MSLLCIGLTTLDVAMRPVSSLPPGETLAPIEQVEAQPAGTAAGCAYVAARLGMRVALAGAVGQDRIGRFVRAMLEEEEVDTRLLDTIPDTKTSTTVLAIGPDGRRPRWHALGAAMLARGGEALDTAAARARHVHWAGTSAPALCASAPQTLAAARAAGAVVTCDLISPMPGTRAVIETVLPHVDYFLPSTVEALELSGCDTIESAAQAFIDRGARNCIIKDGANGVYLAVGETRTRLPAHDIVPVDTTSCGDSFCAGFVAALDRGEGPVEAARFGVATAALVAGGVGTLGLVESYDQVAQAMTTLPLRSL